MAPRLAIAKAPQSLNRSPRRRPPPAPDKAPVAMLSPQERELRSKLKELREHLTKNADNVGPKFPEEARKMHYGEIEHRSIYGEASPEDAKAARRGRHRISSAADSAGRAELGQPACCYLRSIILGGQATRICAGKSRRRNESSCPLYWLSICTRIDNFRPASIC